MANQFSMQPPQPSLEEILSSLAPASAGASPLSGGAVMSQSDPKLKAPVITAEDAGAQAGQVGSYSAQQYMGGSSPDEKSNRKELYQKLKESMDSQKANIEATKAALKAEELNPANSGLAKLDLRPFAEAMRGYGATSVAAQAAPEDRTEIQRKMRNDLRIAQGGLTDDEVNFLKTQMSDKQSDRQNATQNRFLAAQDTQAFNKVKSAFDAPIKDLNEFNQNLYSVKEALASGDIGRLNANLSAIARMQGEKGPLSDGDISRSVPPTMRNKVAEAIQKWKSDPEFQADPAVLKVIAENVGALESAAKNKYTNRLEQQRDLFAGAPGNYEFHANRLYGVAKKVIEPKEANAKSFSREDQEAIEWAKSNPKDPRSANILKIHGVK